MVNELPIRSALTYLMLFSTINYYLVKKESKNVKLKMFAGCSIREQKASKRIYFAAFFNEDFYGYGYSFMVIKY